MIDSAETDMPVFLRNDKWMQNNAILEKQVADKDKDCLLCVSIGKKGNIVVITIAIMVI